MHQAQCQIFDSCWCLCKEKEGLKKIYEQEWDENILAVDYWKNILDTKTELKDHTASEK